MIDTAYRSAKPRGIANDIAKSAAMFAFCLSQVGAAAETYSPNLDDAYPDNVYWGDTHLHSYLSGDAFALGSRLTPDNAYRFAKGEVVQSTGGEPVRLRRPLDFLMVSDHAENLGVLPRLAVESRLLARHGELEQLGADHRRPAAARGCSERRDGRGVPCPAKPPRRRQVGLACGLRPRRGLSPRHVERSDPVSPKSTTIPASFTTFVGYEWSARGPGEVYASIHRNVLYADGPELTGRTLPFSRYDSDDPEELWAHLADYEERLGGNVISIPHNSNLSGGEMFSPNDYAGRPLTPTYARS